MKHTPRPWRLGEYSELYGWEVHRPDESFLVARVQADTEDHVEGKANARLIAAAPDLLQAAERVLGQYVRGEQIDMGQLSEAFKKAKGRGAALAALSRLLDESQ